jgi:hypothetical protein
MTASTPLADLAKLGSGLLKITQKIEAWAKAGADDAAKKKRAGEAKAALDALHKEAVASQAKRYTEQSTKVDGGWSALDYTKPEDVAQADRVCSYAVVWDIKQAFLKNVPSSLDEQLVKHFATWLGVEANVDSTVGYDKLVASVAESGKPVDVRLIKPPTAPPPPIVAPTPPPVVGPVVQPLSLQEQLANVVLKKVVPGPVVELVV